MYGNTSLWIVFVLMVASSASDPHEEKFFELYGSSYYSHLYVESHTLQARYVVLSWPSYVFADNPDSSGRWESMRSISSDLEKLTNIALQAHKRANMLPTSSVQSIAFLKNKILSFANPTYYPIYVDTIVYTIPELPRNHLYLSKGLKNDCVFYLTQWRPARDPNVFHLGTHWCGVLVWSNHYFVTGNYSY
jgi:hypothetical protein